MMSKSNAEIKVWPDSLLIKELLNEKGKRLIHFCISRNVVICNNYHGQREGRNNKTTFQLTERDIDPILIDGQHTSDMLDWKVCRNRNKVTNYYIVIFKVCAKVQYFNA